jgi:WD40 repeat protein
VAFSHLNELAAASQDGKVWLWKASYGPVTRKVAGAKGKKPSYVTTIAVQAAADGILTGALNGVNAVAFSPDGGMIAAGTADSSVLVWNLARRELTARIPAPQPVTSVAWDDTGQLAAGQADGVAAIWTLPAPELLTGNASTVVEYSPDGKTMAVGGSSVQLWNVASRSLIATRPLAGGASVNGMSYSPTAPLLAVAYSDGTVAILDPRTLAPVGQPFRVTATGYAASLAFSPDGATLAAGTDNGTLQLWSVASPAHPRLLATEQDSGAPVSTVRYAPDGHTLAAASRDGGIRLWNVASPASPVPDGAPLAEAPGHPVGLAFTPDSTVLAVPVGAPLTGPAGAAWATAISPDGTLLAVGSADGTVWLWNIASPARPTLIATLTGPAGRVFSVAFNPAGTQVAVTSDRGAVSTWDTDPADARAAVCADLGQPLTRAEWAAYMPGVPYKAPCSSAQHTAP